MIEVTIEGIRTSLKNYERVVILKEKAAERYLPIWIGAAEANAIAAKLQEVAAARPMTHDLLCSVIEALGATISLVSLNELRGDTYYAKIVINAHGRQAEIDSRPSDALALAATARVPIFVEETIMDRAGILLDKETGEPVPPGRKSERPKEEGPSEDELRRMSAFRDFIDKLDLDDLDKHKS
jgi:bifunctional DNase/RNase